MSIIKKDLYMLDTINATKIYDNFIGPLELNYYHSFNCYFAFTAVKNVKKITLKSVEMPIILPTIRKHNNSFEIGFTFSYGSFNNVSISIGNSLTVIVCCISPTFINF